MINTVSQPITVVSPEDYPKTAYPEFVFLGRSNVGKSSFINALLNRKAIARTSAKPGKTRTINFYAVNDAFYVVDVPGYGYAKVSKSMRESFGKMIEAYLTSRETLRHAYLLVDARHEPLEDDLLMANYLKHFDVPFTIIATKADKLSHNARQRQRERLKKGFKIDDAHLVFFSAVTKMNRDTIIDKIQSML